jgi:outer membrane protein OmpA-like peptidoglycan-associated protein
MTRLTVPIVILLLLLFGGAVAMLNTYLDLPDLAPTAEKPRPASKEAAARDETIKDLQTELSGKPAEPIDDSKGSFDVARVDPEGTSVFAGRAAPGANVTIMGDGQELGTAQADENGEWTFATEHKFANADPKLALVVKSAAEAAKETAAKEAAAKEDRTKVASAEQRETVAPAPKERPSAKAVTKNLLKNLEGMVEAARQEPQQKAAEPTTKPATTAAATPPPATTPAPPPSQQAAVSPPAGAPPAATTRSAAPQDSVAVKEPVTPPAKQETAKPDKPSTTVAAAPRTDTAQDKTVVPVPITFVFNEAEFTEPGKKAAGLLLEYLRLKQFKSVSLTGHADERGTEGLNMDLSRERLETVSQFLKEGGFKGKLDLEPKGETEPFKGVDRSQYGKEELFQLDRRVELLIDKP